MSSTKSLFSSKKWRLYLRQATTRYIDRNFGNNFFFRQSNMSNKELCRTSASFRSVLCIFNIPRVKWKFSDLVLWFHRFLRAIVVQFLICQIFHVYRCRYWVYVLTPSFIVENVTPPPFLNVSNPRIIIIIGSIIAIYICQKNRW